MKETNETLTEWEPEKSGVSATDEGSQPAEAFTAKKLALLQKCALNGKRLNGSR